MKPFLLCFVSFFLVLLGTSSSASPNDINSRGNNEEAVSPATPSAPASGSHSSSLVTPSPIMRAIEIIEFVSQFSNTEAEGFGVAKVHSSLESESAQTVEKESSTTSKSLKMMKTSDPLTTLSSVIVYGGVKVTSIVLSVVMYALNMFAPGLFATLMNTRSGDPSEVLENLSYSKITSSLENLPNRSFELFGIHDPNCQNRAMCEMGQSVADYYPPMKKWVRLLEQFLAGRFESGPRTETLLRGLGWADCQASYKSTCPRSPFKRFQQLVDTFNQLY